MVWGRETPTESGRTREDERCGGERFRLGESALDSVSGVGERDADWERAHFRVGRNELRRMMSTGRERT